MSINSKARRDARRKNAPHRREAVAVVPLQAQAHLRDPEGRVVGGAGLRDGEWSVILEGRVVANTDSAAMVIAMLQRVVTVCGNTGLPLALDCAPALQDAATTEALAMGLTLEAYLVQLEAERVENAQRREFASGGPGSTH